MAQVAEVDRGTEVWLPVASSAVSIDPGVWGLGKRLNQAKQRLDGLILSILMLPAQLSLLSQSGWGRAGPVPPLFSCFQLCPIHRRPVCPVVAWVGAPRVLGRVPDTSPWSTLGAPEKRGLKETGLSLAPE